MKGTREQKERAGERGSVFDEKISTCARLRMERRAPRFVLTPGLTVARVHVRLSLRGEPRVLLDHLPEAGAAHARRLRRARPAHLRAAPDADDRERQLTPSLRIFHERHEPPCLNLRTQYPPPAGSHDYIEVKFRLTNRRRAQDLRRISTRVVV